jgi:hypothetical protein
MMKMIQKIILINKATKYLFNNKTDPELPLLI